MVRDHPGLAEALHRARPAGVPVDGLDRAARARSPRPSPPRLSTMKPVMPGSTSSGTLPRPNATTGQPESIASMSTSPNGSSQVIGTSSARASRSSGHFLRRADGAEVADVRRREPIGQLALGVLAVRAGGPGPATRIGNPASAAASMAVWAPFVGPRAGRGSHIGLGLRSTRRTAVSSSPWWMTRQSTRPGSRARWSAEMATYCDLRMLRVEADMAGSWRWCSVYTSGRSGVSLADGQCRGRVDMHEIDAQLRGFGSAQETCSISASRSGGHLAFW